jgi:hypothetical protein
MIDSYLLGTLSLLLVLCVAALAVGHVLEWGGARVRYQRVRAEWDAHVARWGDLTSW